MRTNGAAQLRIARLLTQTVREFKKTVPKDFIVGVRILPEDAVATKGFDIDEMKQVTEWLVKLGVDYVHLSANDTAATSWKYPDSKETNIHRFRSVMPADVALMICGGVHEAKQADFALSEGADLVALGKTAISTPNWPLQAVDNNFKPKPFQ